MREGETTHIRWGYFQTGCEEPGRFNLHTSRTIPLSPYLLRLSGTFSRQEIIPSNTSLTPPISNILDGYRLLCHGLQKLRTINSKYGYSSTLSQERNRVPSAQQNCSCNVEMHLDSGVHNSKFTRPVLDVSTSTSQRSAHSSDRLSIRFRQVPVHVKADHHGFATEITVFSIICGRHKY
jgi:hypothetical protein